VQFTSWAFTRRAKDSGLVPSIGRQRRRLPLKRLVGAFLLVGDTPRHSSCAIDVITAYLFLVIKESDLRLEERDGGWALAGPGASRFVLVDEYLAHGPLAGAG
jgi:hypothetical protein